MSAEPDISPPNPAIPDWRNKTILIAEDEEFNFLYLREVLQSTSVSLVWVTDGEKAVNYCLANQVDLVLMDIKMPRMNGLEATKKIHEVYPQLPVIAQTAYVMNDDRINALNAGCSDFLPKPVNSRQLLKIVGHYI
jgi:CheY-like chemotaxis protein